MTSPDTQTTRVRLPDGYDDDAHRCGLDRYVNDRMPGHAVLNVDTDAGWFDVGPASDADATVVIPLPAGTKPAHAAELAERCALDHPGMELVSHSPVAGRAVLARLAPDVSLARRSAATALGVKPWDLAMVAVRTPDGRLLRFVCNLPGGYLPSRHDRKLAEVATAIIGTPGWSAIADPAAGRLTFLPAPPEPDLATATPPGSDVPPMPDSLDEFFQPEPPAPAAADPGEFTLDDLDF